MAKAVIRPAYTAAESGAAAALDSTAELSRTVAEDAAGALEHRAFRLGLRIVNCLLLLAVGAVIWSAIWEYSTQRYVDAFSDAIVPVSGLPEQKVQAILDWMANPPGRIVGGIVGAPHDRDPLDTLNYQSLLQVCGTATNAFINLADTSGLQARRLLLLDAKGEAKHVDAEVQLNGRWVVVDPTFRVILRGADGGMLTSAELADPTVLAHATRNIPKYVASYSFERTGHVRLGRIKFIGPIGRRVLDFVAPGWDAQPITSLVLERESLGAATAAMVAMIFFLLMRLFLRWYGRKRLNIQFIPAGLRLRRAYEAFANPAA